MLMRTGVMTEVRYTCWDNAACNIFSAAASSASRAASSLQRLGVNVMAQGEPEAATVSARSQQAGTSVQVRNAATSNLA